MTDLTKAIRQLEPLAQAIIVLAKHADDLDKLEAKVSEVKSNIEQRQHDWEAAEAAAAKAKASVIEANSQVVAAQARIERQSEEASKRAQQILAEAKAEAHAQAKDISKQYQSEHARLKRAIDDAKDQLSEIDGDIAEHQKVHDAVLASIESLSKRLVGAA